MERTFFFFLSKTSLPLEIFREGEGEGSFRNNLAHFVLFRRRVSIPFFALLEAIASRGSNVADFPGDLLLRGKGGKRARSRSCSCSRINATGRGGRPIKYGDRGAGCGACACARPSCAAKGSATIGKGSPEKGKTGIGSGPSDVEKEPAGEQKEATSAWRTVCVVRATERQTSSQSVRDRGGEASWGKENESDFCAGVTASSFVRRQKKKRERERKRNRETQ